MMIQKQFWIWRNKQNCYSLIKMLKTSKSFIVFKFLEKYACKNYMSKSYRIFWKENVDIITITSDLKNLIAIFYILIFYAQSVGRELYLLRHTLNLNHYLLQNYLKIFCRRKDRVLSKRLHCLQNLYFNSLHLSIWELTEDFCTWTRASRTSIILNGI